ncbi:MAG: NAD(P)H-quinone oxidoreductase [Alphaproteobacteria bacterium]
MMAIDITEPGGPEVLKPGQKPLPTLGEGELLIKVAAAGVNRPDVMQRQGNYPPPKGAPDTPGLEVSGTIVALADDVTGWAIGDEVCALVAGGGYAEYCAAPALQCLPIPKGISIIDAAALPETFFTVWDNVFTRGGLSAGESILIHGGSSGIGTTAIQLAVATGATAYVTAGSDEKCKACEQLGATKAINYRDADFVDVIQEATDKKGVNVVLDMVGGDYVARNLRVLAKGGRLVQIAVQHGTKAEIPVHVIMTKQITFTGSTLRPRSVAEKALITEQLRDKAWPLIEAGKVKPLIFERFPLADAAKAHALMDSSAHIGKIVLTV